MLKEDCVFCKMFDPAAEKPKKWHVYYDAPINVARFEPLNPVTEGHLLFVPGYHIVTPDDHSNIFAETMRIVASFCWLFDDYNIIVNAGAEASQTIQHLHVHVVPRRMDDGLLLPWALQPAQDAIPAGEM